MAANVFTVGNFKGGVGKTKIATMLGYDNAIVRKRRTLVIDMDPQANASTTLSRTGNISELPVTIMDGLRTGSFEGCRTAILPNLDLIASTTQFSTFEKYAFEGYKKEIDQIGIIKRLLAPIRDQYDEIFIDVPPTISIYSDNAMTASNYSIVAFQTADESLDGVRKYVSYQNFMARRYGIGIQVVDIIPCMTDASDKLDKAILQEARGEYGNAVSDYVVTYQKRLRNYSRFGISITRYKNGNMDQWDFNAHNLFIKILAEIDNRIAFVENSKEAPHS